MIRGYLISACVIVSLTMGLFWHLADSYATGLPLLTDVVDLLPQPFQGRILVFTPVPH